MSTYKRISFEAGPLTAEKLNDLVENMDYLRERMVLGHYFVNEHTKENALIVQGTVAGIDKTASTSVRYADIFWPLPFTTGCQPIITVGHYFNEVARYHYGMRAINGTIQPDNRGFRFEVALPKGDGGLFASRPKWGDKTESLWSFIGLGF